MAYWSAKWVLRLASAVVTLALMFNLWSAWLMWDFNPAVAWGNLLSAAMMFTHAALCEAGFQIMRRLDEG